MGKWVALSLLLSCPKPVCLWDSWWLLCHCNLLLTTSPLLSRPSTAFSSSSPLVTAPTCSISLLYLGPSPPASPHHLLHGSSCVHHSQSPDPPPCLLEPHQGPVSSSPSLHFLAPSHHYLLFSMETLDLGVKARLDKRGPWGCPVGMMWPAG